VKTVRSFKHELRNLQSRTGTSHTKEYESGYETEMWRGQLNKRQFLRGPSGAIGSTTTRTNSTSYPGDVENLAVDGDADAALGFRGRAVILSQLFQGHVLCTRKRNYGNKQCSRLEFLNNLWTPGTE
jgi:hypothetical protein